MKYTRKPLAFMFLLLNLVACSKVSLKPGEAMSDTEAIRASFNLLYNTADENGVKLAGSSSTASVRGAVDSVAIGSQPIPTFSVRVAADSHRLFQTIKFNVCTEYTRTGTALPAESQTFCAQETLPPNCSSAADLLSRNDYQDTLDRLTERVGNFAANLGQMGFKFDSHSQLHTQEVTLPDGTKVVTQYTALKIKSAVLQDACDPAMVKAVDLRANIEPTVIRLTWQKEGTFAGFKGFRVLRSVGQIPASCSAFQTGVVTVDEAIVKSATAYNLAGLKDNTEYGVLVCPVGVSQVSDSGETLVFGEAIGRTFTTKALPPQEVSGLTANVVEGLPNATLKWTAGQNATVNVIAFNNNGTLPPAGCATGSAQRVVRLSNATSYTVVAPWENNIERNFVVRICSARAGYPNTDGVTEKFILGYPTLAITSVPSSVQPGGLVTVVGNGFVSLSEMSFGGAALISPAILSSSQLTFKAPATAGSYKLRLARGSLVAESVEVTVKPYSVALGESSSCAIDDSGLKCWGSLSYGMSNIPALSNPKTVAASGFHACAIDDSGLKCWGDNYAGQTNVASPSNPKMVATGAINTCAIGDSGLKCWGHNNYGQTNVPPLRNPKMVAVGYTHVCAIDDSGLKCWGNNYSGQTNVPPLSNPKMVVAGGYHTCAIDDSGLKCWGYNNVGQTNVPQISNPKMVSAGVISTCAIDDSGLKCWGGNEYGQTNVPSLSNPRFVSAGDRHTCALDDSGLKCWGYNLWGQTNVPPLSFSGLR